MIIERKAKITSKTRVTELIKNRNTNLATAQKELNQLKFARNLKVASSGNPTENNSRIIRIIKEIN